MEWEQYIRSQETEGKSAEVEIDLKWSLWSADEGYWEERAPAALVMLRGMNENTLVIKTSPKKEIRYGTVTITGTAECEGDKGDLKAIGRFEQHWDEPLDLMDTCGFDLARATEEDVQCFTDSLPFANDCGDPGVYREFEVKAETVAELLQKIDAEEDALIQDSTKQWADLEAMYKKEAQ